MKLKGVTAYIYLDECMEGYHKRARARQKQFDLKEDFYYLDGADLEYSDYSMIDEWYWEEYKRLREKNL